MEEIAKEFRYEPLPGELRVAVIAAWQRGGLLPKTAIELMIPIHAPMAEQLTA